MARSTISTEDEESFEIEVLRNASQTSYTCNYTAGSISDLSLICRNQRKRAELTPMKGRGNGEQKNGCCHSTPVLGSTSNNMLLKEYFSRLSLPVTPIAPCAGNESHFEQDAINVPMHKPVGKTLLELAATHQSTTDGLHFGEIGLETSSDTALTSGFTKLFKNQTTSHAIAKKTDTDSDVPVCILVELSKKRPRLQYNARLMDNGIPEDILTKLHNIICPTQTKKRGP